MNYKICAFADEVSNDFSAQIEALKSKNIGYLEIRNLDGKNVADLSVGEAQSIRERLENEGIRVWSVGSRLGKIGVNDTFAPHLDEFKHTLELADALGCDKIRMFSFYIPKEEEPSVYRDTVMERLSRFVEVSEGSKITLCHENEKGIYGDTAERCLDILKNFPEIRAVFDPANFVQCQEDTLLAWQMLEKYVSYLHIKDALCDGSIVPAGYGTGNLGEIIKRYSAFGEVMTLEPHLVVFEGLQSLERENVQEREFRFEYASAKEAFCAAYDALKKLI